MLIRLKFQKVGAMRFIGHLDILRYFQKALSRSGLQVKYSEGFHPHPVMSFASPLGVGLSSDGEYMDTELVEDYSENDILERMNRVLSDEIRITMVCTLNPYIVNQKKVASMSLVSSADYLVYGKAGCRITEPEFRTVLSNILEKDDIQINKKTKTTEETLNIRPYIYNYGFDYTSFLLSHVDMEYCSKYQCSVKIKKDCPYIYLRLSAGSVMNLKPETVLKAAGDVPIDDFQMHRLEIFHQSEKGCIPLWAIK